MGQRSCILKLLLQLYLITTHLIPHQYTLPNADQKKLCITNDCLMIWRKGTLKAIEDTKTSQCHAPPAQHEIEMLDIFEGNLLEVPRPESLFSARGRYFSRQICAFRTTTFAGPLQM